MRRVSGAETIRALERLGFIQARQRGSHVILKRQMPGGAVGCAVPLHREFAAGTIKSILRQAKVTSEKFLENL